MSNANGSKNTSAPSTTNTTPPPPASSSAKPTVTPGDVKVPAGNGAPSTPSTPAPSASSSEGASPEEGNETDKIQYYVIVGKVETFPDVSKAEKFLNSPEAPQCTVIYGKTSLVNEWHITTGTILPFKSLVKAQKFLKDSPPAKDYIMVRGRITVPEVRVSLRG